VPLSGSGIADITVNTVSTFIQRTVLSLIHHRNSFTWRFGPVIACYPIRAGCFLPWEKDFEIIGKVHAERVSVSGIGAKGVLIFPKPRYNVRGKVIDKP
jgi:hypothetical protein